MTVSPDIHVSVFTDPDSVVAAASRLLVDTIVAAQRARGSASVVLTGGGTGIGILAALREAPGDIDWRSLDIYFGDERFVPADDPERNDLQARRALLDHVDLDPDRVHPIAASDGEFGNDPEAAAAAYAAVLARNSDAGKAPVFDVHLLGMGGEGHVNSLFPETDAVREEDATVVAVTDSPKPPPVRVTLTLPAVRHANEVWIVTTGAAKAEAAAAAVSGAPPVEIAAGGARGLVATRWCLDEEAAALVPASARS